MVLAYLVLPFLFLCVLFKWHKEINGHPWCCTSQFCPNKPEPQNFLQVMMKLDMAIYWPVSLTGRSYRISNILSMV